MNYRLGSVIIVALLSLIAGCDGLVGILLPSTVTITLVNESADFNVEGTIVYDDSDFFLRADLTALGTDLQFNLEPGESFSFPPFDCGDVEALILDDADLRIVGSVGPDTESDLLRMGDDFECGDEIVFTFTHSNLILDFDVAVEAR